MFALTFFFSSRRRHTRSKRDWSSDVCSSDLSERCELGNAGLSKPEKIFHDLVQATDFFADSGGAEVLGSARGNGFLQRPKPGVNGGEGLLDFVRQPGRELPEMGKFAFGGALVKFQLEPLNHDFAVDGCDQDK